MHPLLRNIIRVFQERGYSCTWRDLYSFTYKLTEKQDSYESFKNDVRQEIKKGIEGGYFEVKKHQNVIFNPFESQHAMCVSVNNTVHFYTYPAFMEHEFMQLLPYIDSWNGLELTVRDTHVTTFMNISGYTPVYFNKFEIDNTGNFCYHGNGLNVKTHKITSINGATKTPITGGVVKVGCNYHTDAGFLHELRFSQVFTLPKDTEGEPGNTIKIPTYAPLPGLPPVIPSEPQMNQWQPIQTWNFYPQTQPSLNRSLEEYDNKLPIFPVATEKSERSSPKPFNIGKPGLSLLDHLYFLSKDMKNNQTVDTEPLLSSEHKDEPSYDEIVYVPERSA